MKHNLYLLAGMLIIASCQATKQRNTVMTNSKMNETILKSEDEVCKYIIQQFIVDYKRDSVLIDSPNDTIPKETEYGTEVGSIGNAFILPKGYSNFYRADINSDGINDLIVRTEMTYGASGEISDYYVFIKTPEGYVHKTNFFSDGITDETTKLFNMESEAFTLDSVANGCLIGHSVFRKGNEEFYWDFPYECASLKFKYNQNKNTFSLVSHSNLKKMKREK